MEVVILDRPCSQVYWGTTGHRYEIDGEEEEWADSGAQADDEYRSEGK